MARRRTIVCGVLSAMAAQALVAGPAVADLSFTAPVEQPLGIAPVSIAAAPTVAGDTRATLAFLASEPEELVLVRTGPTGAGTRVDRVPLPDNSQPSDVALADVDRDGAREALVALVETGVVRVVRDSGPVITTADAPAGTHPASLAVGDLDGDAWPDLVVSNDAGIVRLMGDGAGGFGAPVDIVPAGPGTLSGGPQLADLDRDGDLDLVFGTVVALPGLPRSVTVLLGDGTGAFGAPVVHDTDSFTLVGPLADANGDGHLDVVLSGSGCSTMLGFSCSPSAGAVLPGDGTGAFGTAVQFGPQGSTTAGVAALDGPGPADVLLLTQATSTLNALLGLGSGTAGPFALPSATNLVTPVDLNGDGAVDLVTARTAPPGGVAFLFNAPIPRSLGVDAGAQTVGTNGPVLPAQIRNEGVAPLTVTGVTVGGIAAADFSVVENGCAANSVAAGDACTVRVRFRPTAAGTRQAELTLTSNGVGSPQRVPLVGLGIPAPPGPHGVPPPMPVAPPAKTVCTPSAGTPVQLSCRVSVTPRAGLKIAVRLVRSGRVYARADTTGAGRVELRRVRRINPGAYSLVTIATADGLALRRTTRRLVIPAPLPAVTVTCPRRVPDLALTVQCQLGVRASSQPVRVALNLVLAGRSFARARATRSGPIALRAGRPLPAGAYEVVAVVSTGRRSYQVRRALTVAP